MKLDSWFDYLFWLVFAFVGGMFIWKMIRHGGMRAAMFGATIKRTVGEVAGTKANMYSTVLKVHQLAAASDRAVGVEFIAKSFASYQIVPISLSRDSALRLSEYLRVAAGEPPR